MGSRGGRVGGTVLLVIAAGVIGCRDERPTSPMRGAGNAEAVAKRGESEPASPSDVTNSLHRLAQQGEYVKLGAHIVPQRRQATIDMLAAAQAVLRANDELREAGDARGTGFLPRDWNLEVMADNLGPFSQTVRIITERRNGDEATVTIQEGGNVPLTRLRFVRSLSGWLYEPAPIDATVLPEMHRLADMLRDAAESARGGADRGHVRDALSYRVLPQIRRIEWMSMAATAEAGEGP